jgi:hypothetical protein
MDRIFPLTRIVLRPYEVDDCEYTFGKGITSKLTKINNNVNNALIQEITGKVVNYDTTYSGVLTIDDTEQITINVDTLFGDLNVTSYDVFLTPYGQTSKLYVLAKTLQAFTVVGDAGTQFYWEIRNLSVAET